MTSPFPTRCYDTCCSSECCHMNFFFITLHSSCESFKKRDWSEGHVKGTTVTSLLSNVSCLSDSHSWCECDTPEEEKTTQGQTCNVKWVHFQLSACRYPFIQGVRLYNLKERMNARGHLSPQTHFLVYFLIYCCIVVIFISSPVFFSLFSICPFCVFLYNLFQSTIYSLTEPLIKRWGERSSIRLNNWQNLSAHLRKMLSDFCRNTTQYNSHTSICTI